MTWSQVDAAAEVDGVGGAAGQDAAFLEVAQAVAEDAGGDHDEHGAGGGEELREVDPQDPSVQPPAQHGRQNQADAGTDHGPRGLAGRLRGGPQEQRGLQALAADGEERGEDQYARAHGQRAGHLPFDLPGQTAGRTAHPEHHRGDEGDRDHTEGAAEGLLGGGRQGRGGEGEHRTEAGRERDRREHTGPHLGEPGAGIGFDEGRDENGDDESGFESLPQSDQEARKRVIPHTALHGRPPPGAAPLA